MRRVGVGKEGREELVPCAVRRPASVPLVHGLPLPEAHTQITPRHPNPIPVQDPVDDPTVFSPAAAALPGLRQMRLQPDPLLVREISPPHEHANQRISRKSRDPPDRPKTVIRRYGRTLPPRDHWPGMPRHARLADGDQIAGETAAVDLVLASLAGTVPAAPASFPLAADGMEQQVSGLVSSAAIAGPWVLPGPAGAHAAGRARVDGERVHERAGRRGRPRTRRGRRRPARSPASGRAGHLPVSSRRARSWAVALVRSPS